MSSFACSVYMYCQPGRKFATSRPPIHPTSYSARPRHLRAMNSFVVMRTITPSSALCSSSGPSHVITAGQLRTFRSDAAALSIFLALAFATWLAIYYDGLLSALTTCLFQKGCSDTSGYLLDSTRSTITEIMGVMEGNLEMYLRTNAEITLWRDFGGT
jgi:hypothetical protein